MEKYEHARGDPNAFLNSLTKDEYTEFMNDETHMSMDMKKDMQNNTGLKSIELNDIAPVTELKDKFQEIENPQKGNMKMQTDEQLFEEFKVFKDCTITEFLDIFGRKYNEELPLYSQLFIVREQAKYL